MFIISIHCYNVKVYIYVKIDFQMSLMSQVRVKIVLYMSQMSIVMFTMSVFIIYVQYFKLNVHDVDIKDHGVHDDIHHDQVDVYEGVDHAGNFSGAKP